MARTSPQSRYVTVIAALTVLAVVAAPALAATSAADRSERAAAVAAQAQLLDGPANGEAAVRALGDRLGEAAALNGTSPARLRGLLRSDAKMWLDEHGRAFYRDSGLLADHAGVSGDPSGDTDVLDGFNETSVFDLSTLPGADRTIYLDFDGHDATGTVWDGGSGYVAAPFDIDGDPTTFSRTERAKIHEVWARIAEDFAPFAVNVTTGTPSEGDLVRKDLADTTYGSRLVVSSTTEPLCHCGGVAYIGTFDLAGYGTYYQPAWVFTVGTGTSASAIAEAGSHEVGHNLGLYHHGTSASSYYLGHNGWAPIMGAAYYEPVTQWSTGEYTDANNSQDDLSVMAAHGANLRADDHAGTTVVSHLSSSAGVIGHRDDTDTFAFDAGAGPATILAEVADRGANLDIYLSLRDDSGTLLAAADPTSTDLRHNLAGGLSAELTVDLPAAGRYLVTIDGTGRGRVADGYSDYASLGRYELHVSATSIDADSNEAPTAALAGPTTAEVGEVVRFDASRSTDPDGDSLDYAWSLPGSGSSSGRSVKHAFTKAGVHTVTVTVTDPSGASDRARLTVDVQPETSPSRQTVVRDATWKPRGAAASWRFGRASDFPFFGDWDGDGVATPGVYRNGQWYLSNSQRGGTVDIEFYYGGRQDDFPLVGDWDGDGIDTVGVIRGGTWHLVNEFRGGAADVSFTYGRVAPRGSDIPLVGDWDGDGDDTVGIVRQGEWHLRQTNSGGPGQVVFVYGRVGPRGDDIAIIGDWDGDGGDTVGIVRGNVWYLRDVNAGGSADTVLRHGAATDWKAVQGGFAETTQRRIIGEPTG